MRSWLLVAFFCAAAAFGQQKPAVTPAAFAKWETLGAGELSPDGKWLAYSIRRVNTDEELRVASLNGAGKDTIAAFGMRPVFSDDSRFLAYTIGMSEAGGQIEEGQEADRRQAGIFESRHRRDGGHREDLGVRLQQRRSIPGHAQIWRGSKAAGNSCDTGAARALGECGDERRRAGSYACGPRSAERCRRYVRQCLGLRLV